MQIVEYADFECPYCGRAFAALKQISAALAGDVRVAFRNFPLTHLHAHALAAAQAAEAAAIQGRFWDMHDLLFAHQDALDDLALARYAQSLGLDLDRFAEDFESGAVLSRIESDVRSGSRIGVRGTPTFFVNGERYEGSSEAGALLAFIAEVMGESGESPWQ